MAPIRTHTPPSEVEGGFSDVIYPVGVKAGQVKPLVRAAEISLQGYAN
jgi:hypothetical protein